MVPLVFFSASFFLDRLVLVIINSAVRAAICSVHMIGLICGIKGLGILTLT